MEVPVEQPVDLALEAEAVDVVVEAVVVVVAVAVVVEAHPAVVVVVVAAAAFVGPSFRPLLQELVDAKNST